MLKDLLDLKEIGSVLYAFCSYVCVCVCEGMYFILLLSSNDSNAVNYVIIYFAALFIICDIWSVVWDKCQITRKLSYEGAIAVRVWIIGVRGIEVKDWGY